MNFPSYPSKTFFWVQNKIWAVLAISKQMHHSTVAVLTWLPGRSRWPVCQSLEPDAILPSVGGTRFHSVFFLFLHFQYAEFGYKYFIFFPRVSRILKSVLLLLSIFFLKIQTIALSNIVSFLPPLPLLSHCQVSFRSHHCPSVS